MSELIEVEVSVFVAREFRITRDLRERSLAAAVEIIVSPILLIHTRPLQQWLIIPRYHHCAFARFLEHKLTIINKLLTRTLILEKKYDSLEQLVKK